MTYNIDYKLIVFESHPDFSDNSRGLWEFIDKNTDYTTFWIVRDKKMLELLQKKGIPCALENSELAIKMISTARFLITSGMELAQQKRKEQIHISAWHGFPLKVIGFFEGANANPEEFDWLKVITTQTDMIIAPSRLAQLTISGMFATDPRKTKITGYPRNDYIYQTNGREELEKAIGEKLGNSKLIFYLPTMRKGLKNEGAGFENNIFNYPDWDVEALDQLLEENDTYIITKMHFADNSFFNKEDFKLPKRMIFLNTQALNEHYLTIYHIMNAFDILITDYSSVYVDYLLLNRPIIFSCPDLQQYKEDRGFVVDDPSLLMPGVIVKNQGELMSALKSIFNGNDEYVDIRREKMDFFHTYKDGNSSKRLLEEMEKATKDGGVKDSSKDVATEFLKQNSSLYQYAKKIEAEVFIDTGNGFSESTKKVISYYLEGPDQPMRIEMELSSNTKMIRFDPDQIGRCVLKELNIYLNEEKVSYQVVNAMVVENNIIPKNQDPQIIVPINIDCDSKIRFEYKIFDLYEQSALIIEKLQVDKQEAKEKLMQIENSKSWKLTKPIREFKKFRRNHHII